MKPANPSMFLLMRVLLIPIALALGAGVPGEAAMGNEPGGGGVVSANSAGPPEQGDSAPSGCGRGTPGIGLGSTVSVQRLIGMRVTNPINEQIGEVSDLIVDQCGRIVTVVVRVGGFLGVGGRQIHIALDEVRVRSRETPAGMVILVRETRDHILSEDRAGRGERGALPPTRAEDSAPAVADEPGTGAGND